MKRINLVLMVIMLAFFCLSTMGQAPNWAWAKRAGGTGPDNANSVATDAAGNVYVAGSFGSYNMYFGSAHIFNTSMSGSIDLFLAKYDPNGNLLWAKSSWGTTYEYATSVSVDAFGYIYITGYFSSPTMVLGSFTLTNTSAFSDLFIAKYDSSGNVLWAESAGGTKADMATSISNDASGNVYITGEFNSDTIIFGSTTLVNTSLDTGDIFLAKYDSSGTVIWAKSAGGTNSDFATSIKADVFGNVYMTGYFRSSIITFGSFTLTNTGNSNIFLTKYDSSGNVHWAKGANGPGPDMSNSVTTDAIGNVYIAGEFASPTLVFGLTTLTNAGSEDIFIAKFDESGNALWAKSVGGPRWEDATSLTADALGNVYLVGEFQDSTITFGTTTLTIDSTGHDIFIAKYASTGNVLWAKSAGGSYSIDWARSVTTDDFGNVYVTGFFMGPYISFGTTILTNDSSHNNDIFLVKINSATGINEILHTDNQILLSPNPFTTQTMLTIQGTYHNPSLFIYNLLGQEVKSIHVGTNTRLTINRERLPNGMYFYKLIEEDKEVLGVGKLLVE